MAITTEELNIRVKVDSTAVDTGINNIKAKLAELDQTASGKNLTNLSGLTTQLNQLSAACSNLSPAVSVVANLATQFNQLANTSVAQSAAKLVGAMQSVTTAANNLTQTTSGQNFTQAAQTIAQFTQTINQSIANINLNAFSQYAKSLAQVAAAYKVLNGSGGSSTSNAKAQHNVGLMVDLTKHLFNLKPDFFIEAYKKFGEIMKLPFEEFFGKFAGWGKSIKNLFSSIERIAFYRAIRTGIKLVTQAIKTGINNLYQWAAAVGNSFKPTMDSLATSFQYLQNSIGAAVSPLLDMAAPVLEYIINAAVAALNVLNQLFSLLGGKATYRRAIRQNKEYAKAANSAAGGAGALNDELERTILAFDEINKLNGTKDKAGGGGGGGGADVDYAGMFEEVEIDNGLADLINADSWEAIGIAITNRLADAMESIDWGSIQDKTAEVAYKVATLLNGAFSNKRFWIDIGTTIAEGLNTYTLLDTTFFHNTKFEDFGDSLAEALRQSIITIDWRRLGEACVSIPTAIVETIHGFVENWSIDDWSFLGTSIAEMVNGALLEIPFATAIPDFVELATGILHSLNTAIKNIKWSEVLGNIADGFKNADWGGLISELAEFLWNTKWVIAIALTLEIGKVGLSLAGTALKAMVFNAVLNGSGGVLGSGAGAAGAAGAASGAGLFLKQAIPIVAGLALSIGGVVSFANALNTKEITDDILSAVSGALGGALVGFKLGGPLGAVIGATIPVVIDLTMTMKRSTDAHIEELQDGFEGIASNWKESGVFSDEQIDILDRAINANSNMTRVAAAELIDRAMEAGSGEQFASDIRTLANDIGYVWNDDAVANAIKEAIAEARQQSAGIITKTGSLLSGTNDVPYSIAQAALKNPDLLERITQLKAVGTAMSDFAKKTRDSILGYANVEPKMVELATSAGSSTYGVQKFYSASLKANTIATTKAMVTSYDIERPVSDYITDAMGKAVAGITTGAVNTKAAAGTLRSNILDQMSMASDMLSLANSAMSHFRKGLNDALVQVQTSANSLRNAVINALTMSFSATGLNIGNQLSDGIRSQAGAVASAGEALKNTFISSLQGINVVGYGADAANQFVAGVRNMAPQAQDAGFHVRNYLINGLASSSQYAYQWGVDAGSQFAAGLRSQVNNVANAATSIAQVMRSILHFSEPDIGPLSDASTYMPDFMMLMAQGIRENAWRVKAEVDNVAASMNPTFNNNANYSVDAAIGGGMAVALADALGGVSMQMNGSQPINVFIGGEKLDSLNARSQARTSFRSGGR